MKCIHEPPIVPRRGPRFERRWGGSSAAGMSTPLYDPVARPLLPRASWPSSAGAGRFGSREILLRCQNRQPSCFFRDGPGTLREQSR